MPSRRCRRHGRPFRGTTSCSPRCRTWPVRLVGAERSRPERPSEQSASVAAMAVKTKDHTLSTADGPMRLYEAIPDGPAKGAVIVVMEAFGVNDHIESVA